jgi:outer membrane protein OmpA-like peptidoglycan-associated protein
VSRKSQALVNQVHVIQPSKPSVGASLHRSSGHTKIGNQTAQRLLRDGLLQAKLTVSEPGDAFEREADRVADQVMRSMPMPVAANPLRLQRACTHCRKELDLHRIQRMCSACEEELHRKPSESLSGPEISSSVASQISGLRGGGQPLPETVRTFFEPRFGQDFSDVRIHTGSSAARTAQAVSARAYTMGRDIVFAGGHYQPSGVEGKRLLAHELTHVVQQSAAGLYQVQRQAILADAPAGLDKRCQLIPDGQPASGGLDFLFAINSSAFTPTAGERTSLTAFIDSWHNAGSFDDIQVEGFASNDGDQGLNWTLSCERAEAVRNELVAQGVSAAKIRTVAHGASTATPTAAGNRRAVLSVVPRPTAKPSPVKSGPTTAASCPQSVSIEVSRGNDDQGECQYQDALIVATIVMDPCACPLGFGIPITIRFHAKLDGKSFADPAGTKRETQASVIGQTFFLQEAGTTNNSPGLQHSGDIGRPGDPDDTLDTELSLRQTIRCSGESRVGRVLVTNGSFVQQVITWSATADRNGVQAATIDVEQRQVPGRVLPPLRSAGSPYPPFPGVPRDNRCTCHPVIGVHQGASCPPRFLLGGASVGGP